MSLLLLVVALFAASCASDPGDERATEPSDAEQTDAEDTDAEAASPPEPVRFGSVGGLSDAGLYIAEERGYFDEAGIDLEYIQLGGGPDLLNALAVGELDIAGIALNVGLFNAVRDDLGIKLVGDKNSYQEQFSATRLMVRTDLAEGAETEVIDRLVGGNIAITSRVSSSLRHVMRILERNGHDIDDVNLHELAYGNMAVAFENGAIDAAIVLEPYRSAIEREGYAVSVSDLIDINEVGVPVVPIVYSEDFAAREELARRFMLAYMRGVRDYNDAHISGDAEAIAEINQIIADASGIELDVVGEAFPVGLDPDQRIAPEMYEPMQEFFVSQGFMESKVDMTDAVDGSFSEYARAQLGDYEPPEEG